MARLSALDIFVSGHDFEVVMKAVEKFGKIKGAAEERDLHWDVDWQRNAMAHKASLSNRPEV